MLSSPSALPLYSTALHHAGILLHHTIAHASPSMSVTTVVDSELVQDNAQPSPKMSTSPYSYTLAASQPAPPPLALDQTDARPRSIHFPSSISNTMPRNRKSRDSEETHGAATETTVDETTSMVDRASMPLYGASEDSLRQSRGSQAASDASKPLEVKRESWWRWMADKYGSVELDNKGSVARDHLALGKYMMRSGLVAHVRLVADSHTRRTNVPGLASDIFGLCIHWHCRDSALPSQHDNHFERSSRQRRRGATPRGR